MNRMLRILRTFASMPFAAVGITCMGIAIWIMPKPERLGGNHE